MKKAIRTICVLLAALLCGFIGYAAVSAQLPPARPAALTVDVDLSQPAATHKQQETEPEELPQANGVEVEILSKEPSHGAPLRVLIYHTHTYEAYEPDFADQYKETERWRTADANFNIVRVGAELARLLRDTYGMTVMHDETAFEPPRLDSAYQRSLEAIENRAAVGELYDLYIDLHRDAYVEGRFAENTIQAGGEAAARVMFLVGNGSGTYNGAAFAQIPDWNRNLERAQAITEAINLEAPNLCRPVSVKSSRYNQHVSTGALLVEIGNNKNTLSEALQAVPFLARAIAETVGGVMPVIQHPVVEK